MQILQKLGVQGRKARHVMYLQEADSKFLKMMADNKIKPSETIPLFLIC